MRLTILLSLILAAAFAASAQQTPEPEAKIEVRATHLVGPVHMLTATAEAGSGNLVFSAGPDGILLVDAFTPRWAAGIRAALDSVSTAPVRFIVNTHFHGDHIGGNTLFGHDATILSRPGVRARMMVEIHPPWSDRATPPRPPHAWPAVTYDSPVTLHFNGEEIRLIPFPRSHTDADTVVFFTGWRVLAIGDLMYILRGRLGPVSDDWSGGDMQSLERNLAALLPQLPADVKIVSGHGRVLTRDEFAAYHRIMARTLEVVRQRIAAEKNLEQIVAEGLPAELNGLGDWELASESWLRVAHESLTRAAK